MSTTYIEYAEADTLVKMKTLTPTRLEIPHQTRRMISRRELLLNTGGRTRKSRSGAGRVLSRSNRRTCLHFYQGFLLLTS